MTQRMARKELTYMTWDQETEEAGTFSVASEEVLRSRTMKKAKRRSGNMAFEPDKGGGEGAFKDFKGLVASSGGGGFSGGKPLTGLTTGTFPGAAAPCATAQGSVEPQPGPASAADVPTATVAEKLSEPQLQGSPQRPSSSGKACAVILYYKQLAGLNCSVRDWIVKHVNANPFCDLTPVFEEYEKYLATIGQQFEGDGSDHPESEASKVLVEMHPPPLLGSEELQGDSASLLPGLRPERPLVKMAYSVHGAASTPLKTGEKSASSILGSLSSSPLPGFSLFPENICLFGKDANQSKPVSSPISANALESPSEGGSKQYRDGDEEEGDEPPEVVPTKVKKDAFYSGKCKLFYKKGKAFKEKGAGTLHLKPAANKKTQLLVQADSRLGNVLLNILIPPNMPCSRKGKNGVAIVCVPDPPLDEKSASNPATLLFRVKTSKDAEGLHRILLEKKNA
uniref:nuclear pore complex protein Nup50-like n=1 Tax=Jaculus jaculus TaxID=51337 RepID=UPI001E1B4413|nr:nuclear pore complex protein Nup50-like [Jaculus jaculus]